MRSCELNIFLLVISSAPVAELQPRYLFNNSRLTRLASLAAGSEGKHEGNDGHEGEWNESDCGGRGFELREVEGADAAR